MAGERKNRSFVKTMSVTMWLFWCVMMILISVFIYDTGRTLTENAGQTMSRAAMTNLHDLSLSMAVDENAVSALISKTKDLGDLNSENEIVRMVAAQTLLIEMRDLLFTNAEAMYLFVYNQEYDEYLNRGLSRQDDFQLREELRQAIRTMDTVGRLGRWTYLETDGGALIICYRSSNNLVGGVIPLKKWKSSVVQDNDWEFLLTYNDEIVQSFGTELIQVKKSDLPAGQDPQWIRGQEYLIAGRSLDELGLYIIRSRSSVMGGFEKTRAALAGLIFIAFLLIAGFHFYTRREVMVPTRKLVDFMSSVGNGKYELRFSSSAPNVEFETIGDNLNRMLDTIVGLKMKAYEDRIQFDEATLKYVQLQIRPHFFLNALTTIHSMSFQGRNEDIRKYIESLSRNVRYLFKSGLHTVSLQEEAEHVENYIQMQDMLYPDSVFSYVNIAEDARESQVPQLIIHTMVENIYKHAVAVGKLTCILINASMEERDGEIMCHIQVEDDGEGYPSEFLEAMERHEVKVREDGHGVGLWNLTRTLQLMYQKEDLIRFSNKEPQGSHVDIWIPRKPKRQSSVWNL